MAANEHLVDELRDEYILQKGCNREEVLNEIEAWKIDKKPLRELKVKLNKLKKETKALIIEKPQITDLFNPIIVSSYSNSTNFDEEKVDYRLNISSNTIPDTEKYFTEEQDIIDCALKSHKEFMTHEYQKNYEIFENNGLIDENEEIWKVGRIELRENDDDVDEYFLVTDMESYRMSLNDLTHYCIYPGQVVMVRGQLQNTDFMVKEIIADAYKEFRFPFTCQSKIKIAVLTGPFTDNSLDFRPFLNTTSRISTTVNLIIIIGPIVDCENPKIQSFNFQIQNRTNNPTYEQLFDDVINSLTTIKSCKILMVPHERETCHLFPLPMPELNRGYPSVQPKGENTENIRIFPNSIHYCTAPGFVDVEGLNIHIVPYDIISEINRVSVIKSSTMVNRIQISVNQLIQQNNYLPVLPNNLPVEYSKYYYFKPPTLPNILILTSQSPVKPDIIPGLLCVKTVGFYDGKNIGNYQVITSVPSQGEYLWSLKHFRAEIN